MISVDYLSLFILAGGVFVLYFYFFKFADIKTPHLNYSNIDFLSDRKKSWRERKALGPDLLFFIGLGVLCVAFINPHRFVERDDGWVKPVEGVGVYLLLDRSGSMGAVIGHEVVNDRWVDLTRWKRVKEAAVQFIRKSPNDLIGLMGFARIPRVLAPQTLDHESLIRELNALERVKSETEEGTAIGYAIYKAAHQIVALKESALQMEEAGASPYAMKSSFLVVMTDGLQDPSYLDRGDPLRTLSMDQAAEYARQHNIKVYILNVDPSFKKKEWEANRHEMENTAAHTGGKFIILENEDDLAGLTEQLSKAEKTLFNIPEEPLAMKKQSLATPFMIVGFLFVILSFLFQETLWRRLI